MRKVIFRVFIHIKGVMKRKIPNNKTPLNIFYQILKQHLKNCLYVLMNKLFLKRLNDIVYPNRNNSVH